MVAESCYLSNLLDMRFSSIMGALEQNPAPIIELNRIGNDGLNLRLACPYPSRSLTKSTTTPLRYKARSESLSSKASEEMPPGR